MAVRKIYRRLFGPPGVQSEYSHRGYSAFISNISPRHPSETVVVVYPAAVAKLDRGSFLGGPVHEIIEDVYKGLLLEGAKVLLAEFSIGFRVTLWQRKGEWEVLFGRKGRSKLFEEAD